MLRRIAGLIGFTVLTLTLAKPLLAQTAPPASDPIVSIKRLSLGAGVDRQILQEALNPADRWLGVVSLAYNVYSPPKGYIGRIALVARFEQPFDATARPQGVVGIRLTLFQGAD